MTTRREFLQLTAAAAPLAWSARYRPMAIGPARAPGSSSLKILFIGGTGFIGPHMVEAAVARGHVPTLFNRGKTHPGLFPNLEKLVGDRDGGLGVLQGRKFDAVIDTSGYVPRVVRASAQLLKGSVGQYLFISTGDVYQDFTPENMDEDAPLIELPEPKSEDAGKYYGPLKVLCEREVRDAFPKHSIVVRPGWIVGPGDNLNLFTYWPVRIDRGGEVLAPGDPTDPVQIIDARDMAAWIIRMLEAGTTGTFNAFGPGSPLSISEFLYGIRAITTADVKFTWVPTDFLLAQQVKPWRDMPIWYPPIGDHKGNGLISPKRAIAAGLTYRPLAVTSKDTLDWYRSWNEDWEASKRRRGMPAAREAELLALWKKK